MRSCSDTGFNILETLFSSILSKTNGMKQSIAKKFPDTIISFVPIINKGIEFSSWNQGHKLGKYSLSVVSHSTTHYRYARNILNLY